MLGQWGTSDLLPLNWATRLAAARFAWLCSQATKIVALAYLGDISSALSLSICRTERRLHWHAERDRGRLDGGQRADVVVSGSGVGHFQARIGCKDVVRFSEFGGEHGGECEGAVEALRGELAEPSRGFFAVAEEDDGFGADGWRSRGCGSGLGCEGGGFGGGVGLLLGVGDEGEGKKQDGCRNRC